MPEEERVARKSVAGTPALHSGRFGARGASAQVGAAGEAGKPLDRAVTRGIG